LRQSLKGSKENWATQPSGLRVAPEVLGDKRPVWRVAQGLGYISHSKWIFCNFVALFYKFKSKRKPASPVSIIELVQSATCQNRFGLKIKFENPICFGAKTQLRLLWVLLSFPHVFVFL
jgi:hypothetical protein